MDGIHILDLEGQLVSWSPSFERMLGYSSEEMQHLSVYDWNVNFEPGAIPAILKNLIQQQQDWTVFETEHKRKDGSTYAVEISARGFELDGEPYLYASGRDLSVRKATEQTLQQSLDEAKRLHDKSESLSRELMAQNDSLQALVDLQIKDIARQRDLAIRANQSKSEFIANISHELRTPLHAIKGFSNLLTKQGLEAKANSYAENLLLSSLGSLPSHCKTSLRKC